MQAFSFLDMDFGGQHSRPRPAGAVLLAAGTLAVVYALAQAFSSYIAWQSEKAANDALVARMPRVQDAGQAMYKASPAELQGFRNAALVRSQLHTPWPNLLKLLEAVPMENIAVLSVEPVAARRQLRLSAEAKNIPTMLDYLAFLQRQPALRHVTLMSHQVQQQAPGSPVRFQIQAQWGEQ
jgi:Tfp pilus assembly protein PilN